MALRQANLCSLLRRCGPLTGRQNKEVALICFEGHRNLTTNPQYKKPFNYKKRGFNIFHAATDFTTSRLNENSRIITIEGPPSTGKTELAKELAARFKLLHMPACNEDTIFNVNGFDLRDINELFPDPKLRVHDMTAFYSEKDPDMFLHFGSTQMEFFYDRLHQYYYALRHLLSTGQGVVIENSVFSDANYALTLRQFGYFTKNGIKMYMLNRRDCIHPLWKPHLMIYLDAPSSTIVKNLKEKNPQYEGSPALTEEFFDTLRDKFKNSYIPAMSEHMETLQYDATNPEDIELLTLDLEGMDLIGRTGDSKFAQWRKNNEEDWSFYRRFVFSDRLIDEHSTWAEGPECPEFRLNIEQSMAQKDIYYKIPQLAILDPSYWYDKAGNLRTDRPELKDITILSPAKESEFVQGVIEAGPEAKRIAE